jgi:hypothetical protein
MIPAEFRERLYDEKGNNNNQNKRGSMTNVKSGDADDAAGPQKYRLKNYLNEDEEHSGEDAELADGPVALESKPIADLVSVCRMLCYDNIMI